MALTLGRQFRRRVPFAVIVDAHSHIFPRVQGLVAGGRTNGLGFGRIEVGGVVTQLLPPYNEATQFEATQFTAEMLIANMEWTGVDRVVLLQGSFYGECDEFVAEAISSHPEQLSGAMYADPWRSGYRELFEERFDALGFVAAKIEFSQRTGLSGLYPDARLDAAQITWLWAALEERDKTIVLDLGTAGDHSYQTECVRRIAETHAGLRIVIAHLGQPRPSVEADANRWRMWHEQIDLGLLPNVWFDTSSLPNYDPADEYPYRTAERYLKLAIERIGTARILWGTDQPGLLGSANYPQLLAAARHHTASLEEDERRAILGRNAVVAYGL